MHPLVMTVSAQYVRLSGLPYRRLICGSVLLPLVSVLAGCSSTSTVYGSGPWGRSPHLDPSRSVYSSPWYPPPHYPVAEEIYTSPPAQKPAPEPMEPIGPWASRRAAPAEIEEDLDSPLLPSGQVTPEEHGKSAPIVSKSAPDEQRRTPAPARSRLSTLTGTWTIQGGSDSCRLQLSSVPALDLYKASSARCSNKALQDVNAWSVREGNLLLFSRGRVVARLKEDDANFIGSLEGGGALIRLTR